MTDKATAKSNGFSVDWLVKGSLTRIGDMFDRVTGRGWKPSSSLATSGLIERMKQLMDAEVRRDDQGRRYVPHNVRLKMQWDKFSTDSEASLRTLENEFLVAAVDHINDRHYYTYSPLSVTIKPDYFTSGVVLYVSYEKFDRDEDQKAVNVTVDGTKDEKFIEQEPAAKTTRPIHFRFIAGGKEIEKDLLLEEGKRITIGRTKDNDLEVPDDSVSKAHASLLLNKEGRLVVADTGSTNGTFVEDARIAYGKAVELKPGQSVTFGNVDVALVFGDSAIQEEKGGRSLPLTVHAARPQFPSNNIAGPSAGASQQGTLQGPTIPSFSRGEVTVLARAEQAPGEGTVSASSTGEPESDVNKQDHSRK